MSDQKNRVSSVGTQFRVTGRGVSRTIADISDRIGVQSKTAPAGNRGLTDTPNEEVMAAMTNRSNPSADRLEQIAVDFLTRARADFDQAALTRIRYASLAREYGVTNAVIGDALGITESAVRGLLERNADIAGGA